MTEPLPCPCCGSAATVEPHLIEAGCRIGDLEWSDWWTASVNCGSCPLQLVAGGDTEAKAVGAAVAGWNRRAAVGRTASPDGLSVLGGNLVVVADRFTDAVLVLKPELFGDGFDVATYVPRGELEEARALIRELVERRCRRSCADCEHDEDDGCEFMRRAIEVGAVRH